MDSAWLDTAVAWGLRVLYAAVILGAGLWFAFFLSGFVRKQALKNPRIDTTLGNFLGGLMRYGVIIFVIIAVLQLFGVQTASLVAVLGAGALALGLALQGTLGNVASGIIIALMRPYAIGDYVEIGDKAGDVVDVDLFFTELRSLGGKRIIIPNGQALSGVITNYSTKSQMPCELTVGVSYEDDLDHVIRVLGEVVQADPRTLEDPAPWYGVAELGESSVQVTLRPWIVPADQADYRADLIKAVKEAFDREGIEIPYPHAVEMSKGEIERRTPPIKPLGSRNRNAA